MTFSSLVQSSMNRMTNDDEASFEAVINLLIEYFLNIDSKHSLLLQRHHNLELIMWLNLYGIVKEDMYRSILDSTARLRDCSTVLSTIVVPDIVTFLIPKQEILKLSNKPVTPMFYLVIEQRGGVNSDSYTHVHLSYVKKVVNLPGEHDKSKIYMKQSNFLLEHCASLNDEETEFLACTTVISAIHLHALHPSQLLISFRLDPATARSHNGSDTYIVAESSFDNPDLLLSWCKMSEDNIQWFQPDAVQCRNVNIK